eukprot:GFKZ01015374.1.p1 GENE.GFKZ01015374.1~~GFKZ01015374.1.p1  ORF type:complete len:535 (-),score=94.28 GFKZ01015374.1:285-1724(-)
MVFGKFCVYTAGPNTALIKSPYRRGTSRIVIGGRVFAIPIFQRVDSLSLALRTITVHTVHGTTINGVSVDVTSCCQVKIQGWSTNGDEEPNLLGRSSVGGDLHMDNSAIQLAAQHFIGKKDNEIEDAIQKTIAGHQRAIIGVLTVEELYKDRNAFSKRVLDLCHDDMRNMGLTVVSYTVAEISDGNGYIEALGVTQTERVKREATEGAATHQSQAMSKKATAEAESHLKVNKEQERMIESDKLRKVTQANAQREIDVKVAIQQKARLITEAEQDAVLFVERQKASAADAKAELEVLGHRVEKAKLTKMREVNVEADAMLYKARVDADGVRASATAEADRVRKLGEAEADAIRAKGMAEIEVLRERVKVWQECGNQAAILEKMIEVLPKVAAAVSAPLSKTEKMVFVGGGAGGGGPSAFTREMERVVAEVPETVHALTGVDLRKGIKNMMSGGAKDSMLQGVAEGMGTSATRAFLSNGGS